MDWSQIGTQVILGIIGVVISGLGAVITYLINKYIKNDKLKSIVNSLNELVKNSVLEVYQTYVQSLKDKNMFNEEAQKIALSKCLDLIKKNMSNEVKEWLDTNYSNIDDYLKDLIEATIGALKNSGTKKIGDK